MNKEKKIKLTIENFLYIEHLVLQFNNIIKKEKIHMKISNVLKLFASVLMLSLGSSAIADPPKDSIKTEVNNFNTLEIFICIFSFLIILLNCKTKCSM